MILRFEYFLIAVCNELTVCARAQLLPRLEQLDFAVGEKSLKIVPVSYDNVALIEADFFSIRQQIVRDIVCENLKSDESIFRLRFEHQRIVRRGTTIHINPIRKLIGQLIEEADIEVIAHELGVTNREEKSIKYERVRSIASFGRALRCANSD